MPERNRLLVSAGYAPLSIMQLGAWDDALQAVTDVPNDIHLSPEERNEFRTVVRLFSARWRGGTGTEVHELSRGEAAARAAGALSP